MPPITAISVFISYSRESVEHTQWVCGLAAALDQYPEFQVVFDQYDLHPGMDLNHFMETALTSDRVVVIVTPTYVQKSAVRSGGVGYESSVISSALLGDQLQDRFIPVLRVGSRLPSFLLSKLYVDFREDDRFATAVDELRNALLRRPQVARPKKIADTSNDDEHKSGAPAEERKRPSSPAEVRNALAPKTEARQSQLIERTTLDREFGSPANHMALRGEVTQTAAERQSLRLPKQMNGAPHVASTIAIVAAVVIAVGIWLWSVSDGKESVPLGSSLGIGLMIFWLASVAAVIASLWKVFVKAGEPGWAAIVPFYNMLVLLKIAGKPAWWFILMLIPLVNFIVIIITCIALAERFGKGAGFGVGLGLLGVIFFPILGFGDSQYR